MANVPGVSWLNMADDKSVWPPNWPFVSQEPRKTCRKSRQQMNSKNERQKMRDPEPGGPRPSPPFGGRRAPPRAAKLTPQSADRRKQMRLYIHSPEERHGAHDADDFLSGVVRSAVTTELKIRDNTELQRELARLVKEQKTFGRVLWVTHGFPGGITFNKDVTVDKALRHEVLSTETLTTDFTKKGYEKVFPKPTKMYFSGCNVAGDKDCGGACSPGATEVGWTFLESVGKVFLHGGGFAMGWIETGTTYPTKFSRRIVTSHTMHDAGDVIRIVTFGPGGRVLERLTHEEGVGGFYDKAKVYTKLKAIKPDFENIVDDDDDGIWQREVIQRLK